MSCGKCRNDQKDPSRSEEQDRKQREEWDQKNPGCSPVVSDNCEHIHLAPEAGEKRT